MIWTTWSWIQLASVANSPKLLLEDRLSCLGNLWLFCVRLSSGKANINMIRGLSPIKSIGQLKLWPSLCQMYTVVFLLGLHL